MSAGALRGPPLPSPWVQQGVVSVKPAGGPLSSGPSVCLCPSGEVEEEVENPEMVDLPEKLKHQLRHRELFLSRQLESLPATHIRGKCSVTLLNETESLKSYLEREDFFFYSLVYDPQQKTLLADKGEIRVGNRYQADITDLLKEGEEDGRDQSKLETKVWEAHNPLVDKQIDQFLVVARSVGTFARALDCSSSVRQPSLHMSAAAASRDITLVSGPVDSGRGARLLRVSIHRGHSPPQHGALVAPALARGRWPAGGRACWALAGPRTVRPGLPCSFRTSCLGEAASCPGLLLPGSVPPAPVCWLLVAGRIPRTAPAELGPPWSGGPPRSAWGHACSLLSAPSPPAPPSLPPSPPQRGEGGGKPHVGWGPRVLWPPTHGPGVSPASATVPRHGHAAQERLRCRQGHLGPGAPGRACALQGRDGGVVGLRGQPFRGGPGKIWEGFYRHSARFSALEVAHQHHRVLLHVEDHRQIRAAETLEGSRSREQVKASLYPQLVSAPLSTIAGCPWPGWVGRGRGTAWLETRGVRGRRARPWLSLSLPAGTGVRTQTCSAQGSLGRVELGCRQELLWDPRRERPHRGHGSAAPPGPGGSRGAKLGAPVTAPSLPPPSNKPNPNQISVNSIKAGVVNGGAPGQSPGAGRACESCYSKCPAQHPGHTPPLSAGWGGQEGGQGVGVGPGLGAGAHPAWGKKPSRSGCRGARARGGQGGGRATAV
uniref:Uncharacterized protein n=1 Tax=Sus scrofa TaxID=9823 RepID=A0A8D1NK59_PIG